MKYIVLQGDGMPDRALDELGGKTPLQCAEKPNMDYIAQRGFLGITKTIPNGMPPGSDVGNMSILGYDPKRYYTGRAALEASAIGVEIKGNDVAYRCNLVTLKETKNGFIMDDYSCGHISSEDSSEVISYINKKISSSNYKFFSGVSYRNLMVWKNGIDNIITTPPHDITGKEINEFLPKGEKSEKLKELILLSIDVLNESRVNKDRIEKGLKPASAIWLWGQGKPPRLLSFKEKYGINGGVITAVDLIKGLGIYAGMKIIDVPGVTGYLDTNYLGKAEYALESLKQDDFVFIHVEAPDETSHEGNLQKKIKAIEDFDKHVVGRIMNGLKRFDSYKIMLISDHATPISIKTHCTDPVPFVILSSDSMGKILRTSGFDEVSAKGSRVFIEKAYKLMDSFIYNKQICT